MIPKGSYTTPEPGVILLGVDTRTVYTSAIETELTVVSRWLR